MVLIPNMIWDFLCRLGNFWPRVLGIWENETGSIADLISLCCTEVTCAADEFRCASGTQCVDPYAQCNGVADCDDSSDETVELCGNVISYLLSYWLIDFSTYLINYLLTYLVLVRWPSYLELAAGILAPSSIPFRLQALSENILVRVAKRI